MLWTLLVAVVLCYMLSSRWVKSSKPFSTAWRSLIEGKLVVAEEPPRTTSPLRHVPRPRKPDAANTDASFEKLDETLVQTPSKRLQRTKRAQVSDSAGDNRDDSRGGEGAASVATPAPATDTPPRTSHSSGRFGIPKTLSSKRRSLASSKQSVDSQTSPLPFPTASPPPSHPIRTIQVCYIPLTL